MFHIMYKIGIISIWNKLQNTYFSLLIIFVLILKFVTMNIGTIYEQWKKGPQERTVRFASKDFEQRVMVLFG